MLPSACMKMSTALGLASFVAVLISSAMSDALELKWRELCGLPTDVATHEARGVDALALSQDMQEERRWRMTAGS